MARQGFITIISHTMLGSAMLLTWSPVSCIEVKIRANEPKVNRNTVIAESCPV